jgi:hypothetical protein
VDPKTVARIVYRLTGVPHRRKKEDSSMEEPDLPPQDIDVSHIPLHELQRIFHAGPGNQLLERRHVNDEKASRLQAYCSETIDTRAYQWEFRGRWSDDDL